MSRSWRRSAYLASVAAIAIGVLVLWVAETVGFIAGGLSPGGSAYLALATTSIVPVCVGVGALTSQLGPTRRVALELGGAVVGVFFALRVIADTATRLSWLRWATPLGWAEELRPFANPQPLVLLLPVATTALLLVLAARIALRRDIGTGLLQARDDAAPHLALLSSPTAQALRSERTSLLAWLGGVGAFAYISAWWQGAALRPASQRVSTASWRSSARARSRRQPAISASRSSSSSWLSACSRARRSAPPGARKPTSSSRRCLRCRFGRRGWLAGRLLLATLAAAVLSLTAGVLAWVGAVSGGVDISLAKLLEAGANCLPAVLLFLGVAALAYAILPRASAGIAYGLVTVAFLWDLVGSLLGAPKSLVHLTPFAHIGLVPAEPFRVGAAVAMLAIAAVTGLAAIWAFSRRDLTGQ